MKSDHANALGKESIFKTREQYAEIFYLEGDKLSVGRALRISNPLRGGGAVPLTGIARASATTGGVPYK